VETQSQESLFVQVVEITGGRQIGWGANVSELLVARLDDIRAAIAAGTEAVGSSLGTLSSPGGWGVDEVTASFGITLAAEAGVILSKASAEATFDVTVTFTRQSAS
jgi:hypothetical protein